MIYENETLLPASLLMEIVLLKRVMCNIMLLIIK